MSKNDQVLRCARCGFILALIYAKFKQNIFGQLIVPVGFFTKVLKLGVALVHSLACSLKVK